VLHPRRLVTVEVRWTGGKPFSAVWGRWYLYRSRKPGSAAVRSSLDAQAQRFPFDGIINALRYPLGCTGHKAPRPGQRRTRRLTEHSGRRVTPTGAARCHHRRGQHHGNQRGRRRDADLPRNRSPDHLLTDQGPDWGFGNIHCRRTPPPPRRRARYGPGRAVLAQPAVRVRRVQVCCPRAPPPWARSSDAARPRADGCPTASTPGAS
jgi:hypothetical protein